MITELHDGERIKYFLKQRRWSVAELAERMGYQPPSVHSILKKQHLNSQVIKSICDVLDISLKQFFFIKDEDESLGASSKEPLRDYKKRAGGMPYSDEMQEMDNIILNQTKEIYHLKEEINKLKSLLDKKGE